MRKIMLVIDDFNDLLALESFFRRIGFDVLSLGKDILVADAILGFVPDFVMVTAKGRVVDGSKLAIRLKNLTNPPIVAAIYPAGQPPVLSPEAENAIDALVEIPFHPRALLSFVADKTGIEKRGLIEKFDRLRAAKLQEFQDPNLFREEDPNRSELNIIRGGKDFASELISSLADSSAGEATEDVKGLVDALKGNKPVHVSGEVRDPAGSGRSAADVEDHTQPPKVSARLQRYDKFLSDTNDDVSGVLSRADAIAASEKLKADSVGEKEELDRINEEKRAFVRSLFDRTAETGIITKTLGQEAGIVPGDVNKKK